MEGNRGPTGAWRQNPPGWDPWEDYRRGWDDSRRDWYQRRVYGYGGRGLGITVRGWSEADNEVPKKEEILPVQEGVPVAVRTKVPAQGAKVKKKPRNKLDQLKEDDESNSTDKKNMPNEM